MEFLLFVFACFVAPFAWFIIDGLRTGEVQTSSSPYRRSEDPGWYWAMIAFYAGFIAFMAYSATEIARS